MNSKRAKTPLVGTDSFGNRDSGSPAYEIQGQITAPELPFSSINLADGNFIYSNAIIFEYDLAIYQGIGNITISDGETDIIVDVLTDYEKENSRIKTVMHNFYFQRGFNCSVESIEFNSTSKFNPKQLKYSVCSL